MRNPCVFEGAHHHQESIRPFQRLGDGLGILRRAPVAHARIHEVYRRVGPLLRAKNRAQRIHPRVRHVRSTYVHPRRAVSPRRCRPARQRVEQRRLACGGQADDPDFHVLSSLMNHERTNARVYREGCVRSKGMGGQP